MRYCSNECVKENWTAHKTECVAFSKQNKAAFENKFNPENNLEKKTEVKELIFKTILPKLYDCLRNKVFSNSECDFLVHPFEFDEQYLRDVIDPLRDEATNDGKAICNIAFCLLKDFFESGEKSVNLHPITGKEVEYYQCFYLSRNKEELDCYFENWTKEISIYFNGRFHQATLVRV